MKKFIVLFFIGITTLLSAQKIDYNTDGDYVADGYDVVSYFTASKAIEGKKKFKTTYGGTNFKFSSVENLKLFTENPTKYVPEYGGYCAYAMGVKGKKVAIDAETFEIRNGKLYLFYNSWGTNTFDKWIKEGADELKIKADKNWLNFIN